MSALKTFCFHDIDFVFNQQSACLNMWYLKFTNMVQIMSITAYNRYHKNAAETGNIVGKESRSRNAEISTVQNMFIITQLTTYGKLTLITLVSFLAGLLFCPSNKLQMLFCVGACNTKYICNECNL